jgi:hypothetical protein
MQRRDSFLMSASIELYRPNFGEYRYEDRPNRLIVSNINTTSSTKEIIDAIYDNDSKKLLEYMELLDFTKCQFYTYSNDQKTPLKYKRYIMRDFISPFVDMIDDFYNVDGDKDFELFKVAIDHILSKVEFKYMEFIISESSLTDILYKLVPYCPELKKIYFPKFKQYFSYFSKIGLFDYKHGDYSLDLTYALYSFFSEPQIMFSKTEDYMNIFKYILEIVPGFKLFFSKTPIPMLPFDPEYIKMAYCYGIDVNCSLITKNLPLDFFNSYNYDFLPQSEILEFLYFAGRDAMSDFFRLNLDAKILLSSLKPNEFTDINDYTKIMDNMKNIKNFNNSNNNLIEYKETEYLQRCIEDYEDFKFNLDLSTKKKMAKLNIIVDFARLDSKFPECLRLTMIQLTKNYSTFDKDVAKEVRDVLPESLPEHIVGIILSY